MQRNCILRCKIHRYEKQSPDFQVKVTSDTYLELQPRGVGLAPVRGEEEVVTGLGGIQSEGKG